MMVLGKVPPFSRLKGWAWYVYITEFQPKILMSSAGYPDYGCHA